MSTPAELIKSLYLNSLFSDISFETKEKELLPAHKVILSQRSTFWNLLFTSKFRESEQKIVQVDYSSDAYKILLEFAYSFEIDVNGTIKNASLQTLFEVLEISNICGFTSLPRRIDAILCNLVTSENLQETLLIAVNFDLQKVKTVCATIVIMEWEMWFNHDVFSDLHGEMKKFLFGLPSLPMKEIELFDFYLKYYKECDDESKKWAKTNLLTKIAFPSMSQEELTEIVDPSDQLSRKEIFEIFFCIGSGGTNNKSSFPTSRGNGPSKVDCVLSRIGDPSQMMSWAHDGEVDTLQISCNRDCSLCGVSIFCPQENISLNLNVYDDASTCVAEKILTNVEMTAGSTMINFDEGITIEKDRSYSFVLKMKCRPVQGIQGGALTRITHKIYDNEIFELKISDAEPVIWDICGSSGNGTNSDSGQFNSFAFSFN